MRREHIFGGFFQNEVRASRCTCGTDLDAATASPVAGTEPAARPKPGDVTVCIDCGRPWQFGADLGLEPVDVEALPVETRKALRKTQTAVVALRKRPS